MPVLEHNFLRSRYIKQSLVFIVKVFLLDSDGVWGLTFAFSKGLRQQSGGDCYRAPRKASQVFQTHAYGTGQSRPEETSN